MYIYRIFTKQKQYKKYNNELCTIVNRKRDDNLIEVFVPKYKVFILLQLSEIEEEY